MYGRRPNPVFSDDYGVIRDALIEARRRVGLSQAQVAAELGKTKSHVARIEGGQRRVDSLELFALMRIFQLDPAGFAAGIAGHLDARRSGPGPSRGAEV